MARTALPQPTITRASNPRPTKPRPSKAATAPTRAGKASTVPARRGGQDSLLLASTAQLRGGEQSTQQDVQRRARRRRQAVRQLRQVEAVIGRVRLPEAAQLRLHWPKAVGLTYWSPSRVASALLLVAVVAAISWVHSDSQWFIYRENVTFKGMTYVNADDLYAQSGLDSWNIFWLSPNAIRARLAALPTVADAQVRVQLPNQVVVDVQEEQPVALWVTQEGNFWLLPDGTALPEPTPGKEGLLQIIDPQRDAQAWGDATGAAIDVGVLQSAQTLLTYMPAVDQIYFNKGVGLNFHLPDSGAWVYWGDGLKMDQKYTNIVAIQRQLRTAGTQPKIIDVRFEKPILK